MNVATTALLVSTASAIVALSTLVWQIILFRLSGARIKIFTWGTIEALNGSSLAVSEWAPGTRGAGSLRNYKVGYCMELVRLEIVNVGRVPASITDVGLEFRAPFATRAFSNWRRSNVSDSPVDLRRAVIRRGELISWKESCVELPCRLEPGESENFVLDFWAAVDDHKRDRPKERAFAVRAVARPAGGRIRRSRRRSRWELKYSDESFFRRPLQKLERAYREFWRANLEVPRDGQRELAWNKASAMLAAGHDGPTIAQYTEPVLECNQLHAAMKMKIAFDAEVRDERWRPTTRRLVLAVSSWFRGKSSP